MIASVRRLVACSGPAPCLPPLVSRREVIQAGAALIPLGWATAPLLEGKVLLENLFVAPRMGAAGLVLPAGMTRRLPVGMELDAPPGRDSEVLAIGVAIEKILGRIPGPASAG